MKAVTAGTERAEGRRCSEQVKMCEQVKMRKRRKEEQEGQQAEPGLAVAGSLSAWEVPGGNVHFPKCCALLSPRPSWEKPSLVNPVK